MPSSERQRSRRRTGKLFVGIIKMILQKPEKISVSQWAEKYRILDESSNFSGKWTHDVTPYLVGIMDAFNDPYIQEINFCKSTQVGGTEVMLNIIGWIIMEDQAPVMIVYPSDDLAKDISNDRIKPSLSKTPEIKERFYPNSSKELKLKFRGMTLYLRGSHSAEKLASKSIKYLFFDEIDKLDGASKKEASPYNLAKERTRTYTYSRKIYTCSTPTLKTNYVWRIHEEADEQRKFFVPCPHCGSHIIFRFDQIKFPKEGTNKERAEEAVYICQECGGKITDRDKIKILRKGEWRDVKKTCVGKARTVSFWINALYSRFLTWSEIVMEFLKSKDDPDQLQNFVNSWLAEPWEDKKTEMSKSMVLDRQTEIKEFIVPPWAKIITGGVDVQRSSFYWTIRAWGDHMTSQNIAHGQYASREEVEDVMNLEFKKEDGTPMIVNLVLIDSGDQTDTVYDICADNSEWALPVKGANKELMTHYKISIVNKANSKANGMQLVTVDGDKYKDMIAARLRRRQGRGAWMVYAGCDEEYAAQVTNEHKVNVKTQNGATKKKWIPKTSRPNNHYLDAEVYCFAAADMMGVRTLHLQEEENEPEEQEYNKKEEQEWIKNKEDWV
ncbi:MAG: phage terminase large subunit family protein [Eubacterium sp.]|nr:phage terminase large subunit family protein [Eubacterium sp.]